MSTSDRLKQRMADTNLKAVDVVRLSGVSKSSLSQWMSGRTLPDASSLIRLSKALNCDPEWLVSGSGKAELYGKLEAVCKTLPVISWKQCLAWTGIDDFDIESAESFKEAGSHFSRDSFVLKVVDDSMFNPHGQISIPPGANIFVDPKLEVTNGSIVVASMENVVMLKRFVIDGPFKYLMSLNPSYASRQIDVDSTVGIIGVVRKFEVELDNK